MPSNAARYDEFPAGSPAGATLISRDERLIFFLFQLPFHAAEDHSRVFGGIFYCGLPGHETSPPPFETRFKEAYLMTMIPREGRLTFISEAFGRKEHDLETRRERAAGPEKKVPRQGRDGEPGRDAGRALPPGRRRP